MKTNKENVVYEIFDKEAIRKLFENHTIIPTRWRGNDSLTSLSIECSDKPQDPKDLIEIFGLNESLFRCGFKQAISGDGQEGKRIRTLHSSALLSLLCFYGISKNNPLQLNIDNRKITFSSSEFEVKNEVCTNHLSNIDVVLSGEDENRRKVKLFLESKFSEYLNRGKYTGISDEVYGSTYKQLENTFQKMGLVYNNGTLGSAEGYTRHYAGGIKQMISHFIGLKNEVEKGTYSDVDDIYLGEILYVFPDSVDKNHEKLNDYTNIYGKLAEGLNELAESKFKVIEKCYTYQNLFKGYEHLDEKVKIFYSLL